MALEYTEEKLNSLDKETIVNAPTQVPFIDSLHLR